MSRPDVPRYHRVSPRFWTDEKVVRWSDDTKLMALYLLTCGHRTPEGIYSLPLNYAVADLGWTLRKVEKTLSVLKQNRFLAYDQKAEIVLVRNALHYQTADNPNQMEAGLRRVKDLPNTRLFSEFLRLARVHCYRKGAPPAAQAFYTLLEQALGQRLSKPLVPLKSLSVAPTPNETETEKEKLSEARRGGDGSRRLLSQYVNRRGQKVTEEDLPDFLRETTGPKA